jgi:hypothetical protein
MKKYILVFVFLFVPLSAHADFWGGDLPLLAEIVTNTLDTLMELERQSSLMHDEMNGINDKINRIKTISDVVQPSTWTQWRDPAEALRRLKLVYYTLTKEYHSEKSDAIESEISTAMNLVSRISPEANSTFLSGKELEQRGADASPGVAQKLAASGVGSLVAIEAQSQVIQSHITSLLAQILAEANEKEAREVVAKGECYSGVSENLGPEDSRFSTHVAPFGRAQ